MTNDNEPSKKEDHCKDSSCGMKNCSFKLLKVIIIVAIAVYFINYFMK